MISNFNTTLNKMIQLPNIILDINNLINNNKMKVKVDNNTIIFQKITHHKLNKKIIYTPNPITKIDPHNIIIPTDLSIYYEDKFDMYNITHKTTYLQYLEINKLGTKYLPNFNKIIIKF